MRDNASLRVRRLCRWRVRLAWPGAGELAEVWLDVRGYLSQFSHLGRLAQESRDGDSERAQELIGVKRPGQCTLKGVEHAGG